MILRLPQNVEKIIAILENAGFEAYAVGGCVRDSILKREPEDWDITTSAKPEQVKNLFRRTVDTGIAHGTVTVLMGKESFEVTTYRIDGIYEDCRHPASVAFTPNLPEDLKRRDFTINAMAYNHTQGLMDAFGGMEDLQVGVIRCVGRAIDRFTEDALRVLRAVRFAAQLGFSIEKETKEAIVQLAGNLRHISAERIRVELNKLLLSDHPEYFNLLYETGVTKVVFPEFDQMMATEQKNPYHIYTVGAHTLEVTRQIRPEQALRWAALLHDVGKPEKKIVDEQGCDHFYGHGDAGAVLAESILRRLKFDNDTIHKVTRLVQWHTYSIEPGKKAIRRCMAKIGPDLFPYLLEVKRADSMGKNPVYQEQMLENLSRIQQIYQEILEDRDCVTLRDLAITGDDLKEMGIKQGKEVGDLLKACLALVIDEPEKNTKEALTQFVKEHLL